PRFPQRTAGRSSPTSAPCNSAGMPGWRTCPRGSARPPRPNWRACMSAAANHPGNPDWGRLERGALTAGLAGLAVCALALLVSPAHFFRAYLVGYQFWLGVALGCLVILMLQHLTGGAWGVLLRRLLEGGARTVPLLAVLFL